MPPIIEVDHVTKEFRLGQLKSLGQTLRDGLARLQGKPTSERARFKALDDVSFGVKPGEVLGIIGHNGAGKSTLLKLLARISQPTSGSITVRGRVAPLIEVGAGLVADMTGRENIFLNASILGMKRAEIKRKLDEIVAFAELEEFIDTPIKRYSSGMQVRLGFSIATSVESEILIVDEVLAVGDLAFQRKCFDRMENLIRRGNKTVLLVSHNIRQVERLCKRVMLLSHGRLIQDGQPSTVCDAFYAGMNALASSPAGWTGSGHQRIQASGEAHLLAIDLIDRAGAVVESIKSGDFLAIRVQFRLERSIERAEFHIGTHTTDFLYITGGSSAMASVRPDLQPGDHDVTQTYESFPLKAGTYCVRFAMLDRYGRVVFNGETLKIFSVLPKGDEALQDELRIVDLPLRWQVAQTSSGPDASDAGARDYRCESA